MIFALDSATAAASAALWRDGTVIAESYADVGLTHSETLMPLCDEVLRRAGCAPIEVDLFAVTAGPGSFTGLRIGIGILKGLAFASQKPCAAVSTLETLAYGALGGDRIAVAVLDARRERVYHAAFDTATAVRRRCDDGVVGIGELAELYSGQKILLLGDAARVCYNALSEKVDCALPGAGRLLPRAACVCAAAYDAWTAGKTGSAAELAPHYIQLPQAQRERQERGETI